MANFFKNVKKSNITLTDAEINQLTRPSNSGTDHSDPTWRTAAAETLTDASGEFIEENEDKARQIQLDSDRQQREAAKK